MLQFNVLDYDINSNSIKPYNIINKNLLDNIKKERKRGKINSLLDLQEYLKREFKYDYWARAEHEFIISNLFEDDKNNYKIDKWFQIEMNLELITKLVKEELKFKF